MADKVLQSITVPSLNKTFVNTPTSIAPTFNATQSYDVGDYVFYNRKLYRFTSAHNAGAWSIDDVTEVTVGSDLDSLSYGITELFNDKADVIMSSASGSIVNISDGADNLPVKSLVVGIKPVQSGDPSPEDVRPISGWTGLTVYKTGKNLFNKNNSTEVLSSRFIGNNSISNSGSTFSVCIPCQPNTTYTASKTQNTVVSVVAWTKEYPENGTLVYGRIQNNALSSTITTGEDAKYLCYWIYNNSGYNDAHETLTQEEALDIIQIELGSESTSYEPYNGNQYSVSWQSEAGTVYCGEIDVTTGELTVTHAKSVITTETAGNIGVTGDGRIVVPFTQMKSGAGQYGVCNILPNYVSGGQNPMIQFGAGNQNIVLWNCQSLWATKEAFETYIDNNTMEVVYPIVTPQTYQLTPTEIRTLLGTNNIWADTGDVNVEYRADTKSYVDEQIPDVPVTDVQVNGTSVVSSGVANVPVANANNYGVIKINQGSTGLGLNSHGVLGLAKATSSQIKAGTNFILPFTVDRQHEATFYGLAKAAGDSTQSASDNAVGNYTDEAKGSIQHMLGTDNLAPYESDITADRAYAIGELFMLHGKLHRATAAINTLDIFTVGTNCEVVNASDVFARDVQVNGTSVLSNGVANVPMASTTDFGVVKSGAAVYALSDGKLTANLASESTIKAGTANSAMLTPGRQNQSVFYGLAKAAGDSTQSASSNAVGTYTPEALKAIRKMLGIPNMEWEKICDIEVNEDSTEIIANHDVNGLPFKLRKLVGIFSAGASTTGTKDSFYTQVTLYNNYAGGLSSTSAPSFTYPSATSSMLTRIEIEVADYETLHALVVTGVSEGNTQNVQMMPKGDVTRYEYITGFKVYQSGSTKSLIPSGSSLKIYGIRYDD